MTYTIFTKSTFQSAFALIIVFIIDLFTPLGMAIGVLYLFCLFLVSGQVKKTIIVFAIVVSLLTMTKLILFVSSETTYMAFVNRGITLLVIWLTATLAVLHRTLI